MTARKWGSEQTVETAKIVLVTDVAAFADGGFVLTYIEVDSLADTDPEIAAQRYDAFGREVGGRIAVNTTVAGQQGNARVATLADGGFVVTWDDESATGGDTTGTAVRGQRFSEAGVKVGGEFRANTATLNNQSGNDVASLDGGGFVVSWSDRSVAGENENGIFVDSVLKMRRYDADGAAATANDVKVNDFDNYNHYAPAITGLTDGGYVIAWHGISDGPGDGAGGYGGTIRVRRFDALGNPQATEFLAGPPNEDGEFSPTITALPGGGFVIAWAADRPGTETLLTGQVFDATGAKVGDPFEVETTRSGSQSGAQIAAMPNGGFVITWTDQSNTAPDEDFAAVRGQVFNGLGDKIGFEFVVNTTTEGQEVNTSIKGLADGRVLVTYGSVTIVDGVPTGITSHFQIIDPRDGVVVGSADDDVLLGNDVIADQINGYGGDDDMRGLKGDDQLFGGDGDDIGYGGAGDDDAFGGKGADKLWGDAGDDTLTGEAGDDELRGGLGLDTLMGGAGSDAYYVDQAGDIVTEAGGAAQGTADTIFSTISVVNVANVERVFLAGSTNINASGLSSQADQLNGNLGNNILNGFGGNDRLSGKAGDDTFRFTTTLNAATNLDTITDFVAADDTIQLENAVFAGLTAGALAASAFKIVAGPGAAAVDANDRVLYNATTGALFFDSNGSGAGGQTQFATLTGAPTISAADFFVI